MLKYKHLIAILMTAFTLFNTAQAADHSYQANATWRAVAKKDTDSKLVVTSLGNLTFNFAEGTNKFNTETGLFDVTINGDTSATAFKLTSKLLENTITHVSEASTLIVGVDYNGVSVGKDGATLIFDANQVNPASHLQLLSTGYKLNKRISAQDIFTFSIIGATLDGKSVTDYKLLPEGLWSGDITVQFTATWTS